MEALLNKTTVLDKLEIGYKTFEDLLAPLDGWQLTTPGVVGAWSIKDVLIHLTGEQKQLFLVLQAARQGEEPALLTCEERERLNQRFYAAARAVPLHVVCAAFQATYVQVKGEVEALGEETLLDPQRFSWLNGVALCHVLAGNTYEHYAEHMLPIRAWLAEGA